MFDVHSVQFRSVQLLSRVRHCDPIDCSTPGLPVHHQLLEFTQTGFHWVSDAIRSGYHLYASLPPAGGEACTQLASSPLVFTQSFVLQAGQIEQPFTGRLSFLSLSLPIPQFGLLSHISSLRLSSGHSSPVLTLSTDYTSPTSLSSPRSLVAGVSVWATSPLAVVVRSIFCGLFFFSQLCCPLRFQNFLQIRPWEDSYCLETSPSQLPPQDRSLSLTLLSLFLSFIFCPTAFQRKCPAFLGAWCPPPVFRSCFVQVA